MDVEMTDYNDNAPAPEIGPHNVDIYVEPSGLCGAHRICAIFAKRKMMKDILHNHRILPPSRFDTNEKIIRTQHQLIQAVMCYDIEKVIDLSHQGVDVNIIEQKVETSPLHVACIKSMPRMVDVLLRHGAIPNITNKEGNTPLHESVCNIPTSSYVHKEIMIDLLTYGVDPEIKNNKGLRAVDLIHQYLPRDCSIETFCKKKNCELWIDGWVFLTKISKNPDEGLTSTLDQLSEQITQLSIKH